MAEADRSAERRRDDALVTAAQQGDQRALEQLLRHHQPRLHALCRRMTRNDADALDALQEALLAIVRGLHRFDGRAAFGTWAYRVATNACLDELRRLRRVPDPGLPEVEHAPRGGRPEVDDRVSDRLDLDGALADLAPEFRAPVVLRDQLGLDYAEIAEVLDLAPGTVRSRISRGRAALARHLGNRDAPDDVQPSSP